MGLIRSIIEILAKGTSYLDARERNLKTRTLLELHEREEVQTRNIVEAVGRDVAPDHAGLMLAKANRDRTRSIIDQLHAAEEVHDSGGDAASDR